MRTVSPARPCSRCRRPRPSSSCPSGRLCWRPFPTMSRGAWRFPPMRRGPAPTPALCCRKRPCTSTPSQVRLRGRLSGAHEAGGATTSRYLTCAMLFFPSLVLEALIYDPPEFVVFTHLQASTKRTYMKGAVDRGGLSRAFAPACFSCPYPAPSFFLLLLWLALTPQRSLLLSALGCRGWHRSCAIFRSP